jgi:hypothetical protein
MKDASVKINGIRFNYGVHIVASSFGGGHEYEGRHDDDDVTRRPDAQNGCARQDDVRYDDEVWQAHIRQHDDDAQWQDDDDA